MRYGGSPVPNGVIPFPVGKMENIGEQARGDLVETLVDLAEERVARAYVEGLKGLK